jgi:tripartite-type tricarboxylate transporter receptor subunit TctC
MALAITPVGRMAAAQDFPSRPVTIIVPYPPGGPTDAVARLVAQKLAVRSGHPFVISNKPGAATQIGVESVKRALSDGYTWLLGTTTSFSLNPLTFKKLGYSRSDFELIGPLAKVPYAVVVSNRVPATNVREFREWARTKPEGFTYGTVGRGSAPHILSEILSKSLGVKGMAVPYKGSAAVQTDLIAGQLDVSIDPLTTSVPMHKAGKSRVIAIIDDQRWPEIPEVPTLAEQRVNGVEGYSWVAFFAPAGTSKAIVSKMNLMLQQITSAPEVGNQIRTAGLVPLSMSNSDFLNLLQADAAWWKRAVEENNIQMEE